MNNNISVKLSSEQQTFINEAKKGKNILVDACIGSGKTTSIQYLCNALESNKKILYLTYNKLLKLDAKSKIKNSNATVTNYHGFAYQCLRKNNIDHVGVTQMITIFNESEIVIDRYDVLIIDEYQDIETEFSIMLEKIKAVNPQMQIIAVGDMDQKIFDKTLINVSEFIDSFLCDYVKLNFTICFRLNKQEADKLALAWGKKIVGVNKQCIVKDMDYLELIDYLKDKEPREILCLGSIKSFSSLVLNPLERKYPDKFNKSTVFASIRDRDGSVKPNENCAIFTTYDSSKGLERDICIILDFDESYWVLRHSDPLQKHTIMKNIFCVAASRGKKEIIYVKSNYKKLTAETLRVEPMRPSSYKLQNLSSLFDFKYKEDIDHCYSLLNIKKIPNSDNSIIESKNSDELIDLSLCMGIYQESSYFENYNLDRQIDFTELFLPLNSTMKISKEERITLSQKRKVLYLTALETKQLRYIRQVVDIYIDENFKKRLSTKFNENENVQVECAIKFANPNQKGLIFIAKGLADVVKDETVFELKFVSQLCPEHYLQCACYMIALKLEKGILWNIRTNDMYSVEISDKKELLDSITKTVTKHNYTQYREPLPQESQILKEKMINKMINDLNITRANDHGLSVGERVSHATYGEGDIISIKKMGNDSMIEIAFENGSTKKLMANYSKLTPIKSVRVTPQIKEETRDIPKISEGEYFCVLDVETNYSQEVISIGIVIANQANFKNEYSRYYIIDPRYKVPSMFSHTLFLRKGLVVSKEDAINDIKRLFAKTNISSIFTYSSFDKRMLPELSKYKWYDIMKIAAYKQYNSSLSPNLDYFSTGKLKKNYNVQSILRMLLNNPNYIEQHNALADAQDELKIMQLLKLPIEKYYNLALMN